MLMMMMMMWWKYTWTQNSWYLLLLRQNTQQSPLWLDLEPWRMKCSIIWRSRCPLFQNYFSNFCGHFSFFTSCFFDSGHWTSLLPELCQRDRRMVCHGPCMESRFTPLTGQLRGGEQEVVKTPDDNSAKWTIIFLDMKSSLLLTHLVLTATVTA